jgi:FixJ family two-component response regulator
LAADATICLVDDDPGVLVGLGRVLRSFGWNVATFASAAEFIERSGQFSLGCVLLDVAMPGMSGVELHALLCKRGSKLPVIYLTGCGDVPTSVRAMKQGALDFLEKPVDEDVLRLAVEAALAKCSEMRSLDVRLDQFNKRLEALTPREREVMDHVILGRLNKQIAIDLDITEKTVKVHRGRAMKKMGVRSVAALVHLCDEFQLTDEANRMPARAPMG